MESLEHSLSQSVSDYLSTEFHLSDPKLEFQATRKDFEGDVTLVLFPLLKLTRQNPAVLGEKIGDYLVEQALEVSHFNIVSGFLNLSISDAYYLSFLEDFLNVEDYGHSIAGKDSPTLMVEFSSPNTNKPLHLGHIRNNLLGHSVSKILEANGNHVIKTQIINDRGIHICKSMLAWQRYGVGETPESSGLKGDQLVGKYYVMFETKYREQVAALVKDGNSQEEAEKNAPLLLEAQQMLREWENNDSEVRKLWAQMNQWVYDGFEVTYQKLGIDFDSYYYESITYLLGKSIIEEGLDKGVFYTRDDGSVWIDLRDEGLDEKLLLRSDGTAVYMTQDIGTATQRVTDHPQVKGMVYTVGNEQDYHFKVLFLVLQKLGYDWADSLFHLSYGMVDLPSGKMKSREGTVVDADDLIEQMKNTAATIAAEHGKIDGLDQEQRDTLYQKIGLGALKYFILKVDPKKRILFDPEASVDFNGNTGPFIQYAYARIQSLLRKVEGELRLVPELNLVDKEKEILKHLSSYTVLIKTAGEQYSPALVANYLFDLVKLFNSFYQNVSVFGEQDQKLQSLRLLLCKAVANNIKSASGLLGMTLPDSM
ncbi:MAG: arginine--tRNA ligase [Flavobacteriaceae bacterium TMED42]|nr:MAG: arginine--tRNA ligase [Flavobacteriaceae bacterium TMED42]